MVIRYLLFVTWKCNFSWKKNAFECWTFENLHSPLSFLYQEVFFSMRQKLVYSRFHVQFTSFPYTQREFQTQNLFAVVDDFCWDPSTFLIKWEESKATFYFILLLSILHFFESQCCCCCFFIHYHNSSTHPHNEIVWAKTSTTWTAYKSIK